MRLLQLVFASLIGVLALPTYANGPRAQALGACLADNTSGKDRKDLARWIFVSMATHPDIRELGNASADTREQSLRTVGVLLTRLLTENCAAQTRAVIQTEGSDGMRAAFGSLGQLAMQELMSNAQVNATIMGFERYVDRKKIEEALGSRAGAPGAGAR